MKKVGPPTRAEARTCNSPVAPPQRLSALGACFLAALYWAGMAQMKLLVDLPGTLVRTPRESRDQALLRAAGIYDSAAPHISVATSATSGFGSR